MTLNDLRHVIEQHPDRGELPIALVLAICMQESSFKEHAIRYEPHYKWLVGNPTLVAEQLGQKHSWGLMQIMGATARELGFTGAFHELWEPQVGLAYGMRYLNKLYARYGNWADTIAAYNAGIPKRIDGKYVNHDYVDRVMRRWNEYEHVVPLKETEV